ncbi:MAG: alanine racemase [Perlucidibaca sp.]
MREAWLTLDRQALLGNVAILRNRMPGSRLLAMVKADAYGHGVATLAPWLQGQVDGFGVAFIDEALALRAQGVSAPIAVLEGVFSADELAQARGASLDLAVHSPEQLALLQAAPEGQALRVWLKVNTGMNRLGFRPTDALRAWRLLSSLPAVGQVGLMTHFAAADEAASRQTDQQLGRFRALQQTLAAEAGGRISDSLANSAAILGWPEAAGEWMRPGIALYGSSPFPAYSAESMGLRPVMTLRSRVIAVNQVQPGDAVGYSATWVADHPARIAVVAIGYGDGYPRHAGNGTPVLINGQRCALAGRVSMDMITVDRGDVVAAPGDEAGLWGEGLPVDEVASCAGTISYELFCRLTPRVRRPAYPDAP